MQVTEKGQVTIPKHIRVAAGVGPGSEVSFSLDGSKIVITPMGTGVKDDRRAQLRAAAARVRASLKQPVVVDLRNIYDPGEMARLGFRYRSIGRPAVG